MELEGWMLRLPNNAHEVHTGANFPPQDMAVKRAHEDCVENPSPEKEGRTKDPDGGESGKRRRISPGVLRGRSILRDVFNDIIDLT